MYSFSKCYFGTHVIWNFFEGNNYNYNFKRIISVYLCNSIFLKNKIYDFKLQEVLCVIFVIVSIFNLVRAQSINLGVTALRQITIIVTCYYFGCSLKNVKLEKIFSFIVLISVIVGIIGIGLFFLNDEQWIQMGYADYWNNKTGAVTKYSFTNFYTYDLGVRLKDLYRLLLIH